MMIPKEQATMIAALTMWEEIIEPVTVLVEVVVVILVVVIVVVVVKVIDDVGV